MKVAVKSILACAIILTLGHSAYAEYDVNAYCTLVKNGVKLASVEDCQTFYTCMNGRATAGSCPASQAFDKNAQSCRPKSDVKCYFGVDQPCLGQSDTFVPVVNTCNGYIYCKNNNEAGRGQCPLGQIFHQGTCVYGNCNDNINGGATNEGLSSVCQIMPDNTFFGSTKSCKIYQKCRAGTLIQGNCEGEFVFDVNNAVCNYESGNMCSRVTGQDIQPDPTPSVPCSLSQKGEQRADISKCSSYQTCDGAYWINIPCASGQYYSEDKEKCVARQDATPVATCNRCEFTKRQFVNAVDPTCRKYYVCSNGNIQGSGECAQNSYFDEATQACILDKNGLDIYASKNGACKPNGNGNEGCATTCAALSGNKCVKTGECNCGLNASNKCEVCANGIESDSNKCKAENGPGNDDCAETCKDLANADCKPTTDPECKCGLVGSKCGECAADETIDSANKCTACEDYCKALGKTDCEENDECECGLEGDECTLCVGGVDEDKTCLPDCKEVCEDVTDVADCKDIGKCRCGMDNGLCVDCDDGECNTCICKNAEPACDPTADACECYEDGDGCHSCATGVNETEDDCNP